MGSRCHRQRQRGCNLAAERRDYADSLGQFLPLSFQIEFAIGGRRERIIDACSLMSEGQVIFFGGDLPPSVEYVDQLDNLAGGLGGFYFAAGGANEFRRRDRY